MVNYAFAGDARRLTADEGGGGICAVIWRHGAGTVNELSGYCSPLASVCRVVDHAP